MQVIALVMQWCDQFALLNVHFTQFRSGAATTIEAILREVLRNFSTRREYSFEPEDIEPYDTFYSEI